MATPPATYRTKQLVALMGQMAICMFPDLQRPNHRLRPMRGAITFLLVRIMLNQAHAIT